MKLLTDKKLNAIIDQAAVQAIEKAKSTGAWIGQMGWANNFGEPVSGAPDVSISNPNQNVWAYVSINTIGKTISEAPIIAQRQKIINSKPTWVGQTTGPLAELMAKPNPHDSMDIIVWRLMLSVLSRCGYLLYEPDDHTLIDVAPEYVTPLYRNLGDVYPLGYEIGRYGQRKRYPAEQVVHISMPNPRDVMGGLSPMEPAQQDLRLDYYYKRFVYNFFKNGAMPTGAIETDHELQPDQAKQLTQQWNEMHGGPDNQHKVAVLHSGGKFHDITPSIDKLTSDVLTKTPREAILATFGVPPVLAGIFEYANYANSREQIKIFWQHTILPLQRIVLGAINRQLVEAYWPDQQVAADTSQINALQEDENEKATRLSNLKRSGVITPNEAREKLGWEPIIGGDELQSSPVGGAFGAADATPAKSAEQAKSEDEPSDIFVRSRRGDARGMIWKAHEGIVLRYEKQMQKLVRGYFDDQLDRVLEGLKTISTPKGQVISALLYYDILRRGASDDASKIFDKNAENEALRKKLEPFMAMVAKKMGQKAIDEIGIDMEFNVNNPRVQSMLNSFANRIVGINDKSYDDVKAVLQQAYDEGWSIKKIAGELEDKFAEFAGARSQRIAMTEMNGAVNGASMEGYREAGVEKKEWLTAPGAKYPRHELVEGLDGQQVGIDEAFNVDGEPIMFPGDPDGSPENVINCHCGIIAVV
jgi:HK97 family phage portal protein